jgi:hypothetical protein
MKMMEQSQPAMMAAGAMAILAAGAWGRERRAAVAGEGQEVGAEKNERQE